MCEYLYLNTKDQQEFYKHIGYEPIGALNFFTDRGKSSKCSDIMKRLFANSSNSTLPNKSAFNKPQEINTEKQATPPPPPPPLLSDLQLTSSQPETIYWFRKRL